jgi:hypothetical protein
MANHAQRQVYGRGCGGLPVYTSARIEASSERGSGQRRMSPLERNKKANGVCACSEKTPRRTWIARPDADFCQADRFG